MKIKSVIAGCHNKEIQTKNGKKYLTEIALIDTESKNSFYIGQIWDDKFHDFEMADEVIFSVASVREWRNKITLSLTSEYKIQEK